MKQIMSILLALVIVLTGIPMEGYAASVYDPALSIEGTNIPEVSAGASTSIDLIIKNEGGPATNVIITPNFTPDSPFSPNNLTESIYVGDISTTSKKAVALNLTVNDDALEGSYPIPVTIKYNYITFDDKEDTSNSDLQSGTYTETIYVRVNNAASQGKLIIQDVITDPKIITPGQTARVSVMIENKGSIAVNNVTAKLQGLDKDSGFYIASGSDLAYVKKVNGNSTSYVDFYLKASNKIKKGGHELKVSFSYGGIEETQTIYLSAGGDVEQASNLLIENLEYPTSAVPVNGNFTLNFDLRNNGGIKAKNVLVRVESQDPSAVVPKSTSISRISTIDPDTTESLEFVFTPTPSAITRNYPISITVEYEDDFNLQGEKRPILNQFIGLYARNDEADSEDKKGTPRLIIDQFDFSPAMPRAGENFTMNLSFFNTNKVKSINNIKIYLTAESGASQDGPNAGSSVFTPVNSSNTFYIDSISPKKRVNQSVTMFTIPDALAKTHTITANLEYEDSEGNEYTAKELIGVPVVQQSKLEVGELGLQPEAFIGQPMPVSVEFYNTGKVTLYNLMVKLEGDFETENAQYFVGNFASGGSDYFDGTLIPFEPGQVSGAVLFTYEDSTGETQEVRKEFDLNVVDMPPMEEFPGDMYPMPEEESSFLKSPWLWIVLAILLVAGGLFFKKKRKQKREKEMELDE